MAPLGILHFVALIVKAKNEILISRKRRTIVQKCATMMFIDVDIRHRMAPLRML